MGLERSRLLKYKMFPPVPSSVPTGGNAQTPWYTSLLFICSFCSYVFIYKYKNRYIRGYIYSSGKCVRKVGTPGTWERYLISFLSHARLKKESTRC